MDPKTARVGWLGFLFGLITLFFSIFPANSQIDFREDDQDRNSGNNFALSHWKIGCFMENRKGENDSRFVWMIESPSGPGDPKWWLWRTERLGVRTDGIRREGDWFGIKFTTVNFENYPWLRIGMGGAIEEKLGPAHEPKGEVYTTFGYDGQIKLDKNLALKGDFDLRLLLEEWGLNFNVWDLSLLYETDNLKIGPVFYGQWWGEEDFAEIGIKARYSFGRLELSAEKFRGNKLNDPLSRLAILYEF